MKFTPTLVVFVGAGLAQGFHIDSSCSEAQTEQIRLAANEARDIAQNAHRRLQEPIGFGDLEFTLFDLGNDEDSAYSMQDTRDIISEMFRSSSEAAKGVIFKCFSDSKDSAPGLELRRRSTTSSESAEPGPLCDSSSFAHITGSDQITLCPSALDAPWNVIEDMSVIYPTFLEAKTDEIPINYFQPKNVLSRTVLDQLLRLAYPDQFGHTWATSYEDCMKLESAAALSNVDSVSFLGIGLFWRRFYWDNGTPVECPVTVEGEC